jgi:hypothetical protein
MIEIIFLILLGILLGVVLIFVFSLDETDQI